MGVIFFFMSRQLCWAGFLVMLRCVSKQGNLKNKSINLSISESLPFDPGRSGSTLSKIKGGKSVYGGDRVRGIKTDAQ